MKFSISKIFHTSAMLRSEAINGFFKKHLSFFLVIISILCQTGIAPGQSNFDDLAKAVKAGDYDIAKILNKTMQTLAADILTNDQILVGSTLKVEREGQKISEVLVRGMAQKGKNFVLLAGTTSDGVIIKGIIKIKNQECVFTGKIHLAEQRILSRTRSFEAQNIVLHKGKPKTVLFTTSESESIIDKKHLQQKFEYTVSLMADWNEVEKGN